MDNLQAGAKGQHVLDLQCALAAAKFFDGDLDGDFGTATKQALAAYQASHHLPAAGVLDQVTADLLQVKPLVMVAAHIPGITPEAVRRLFPGARLEDVACNLPHVINALVDAGLGRPEFLSMALATIRTETPLFLPVSESISTLNTSPGGKPFDLYDRRANLGNKGPFDGANFRGRGFIQITGKANYASVGQAIGLGAQLVANPLLAHKPTIAAKVLADFLHGKRQHLSSALQQGDLVAARRVVNGGTNGLQSFVVAYRDCLSLLPKELQPRADLIVA